MTIFDEKSCFFRIREHTRSPGEFVGVGTTSGSTGREVLRWQESRHDDQLWLVLPKGENDQGETEIQLMSAVDNGVPVPLLLTVSAFGDFTATPQIEKPDFPLAKQTFRLKNPDGSTFNVQEPTNNEWATIESWRGLLVRGAWSGGVDQLFTFEPWHPPDPPPLHEPEADPGQIGDIPRVTDIKIAPPERSIPKLIGEMAVPSAMVHDGYFSNKLIQFQRSPHYILRREQYWDRTGELGRYHEQQDEGWTETLELVYQVTTETTETQEQTFGVEFSATGGASFAGITAGFSTKVSNTLKVDKVAHEKIEKKKTQSRTVEYKRSCVFVCWSLVDKYTLLRVTKGVREPVQTWTVPQFNTDRSDSFPPGLVTVDGRLV